MKTKKLVLLLILTLWLVFIFSNNAFAIDSSSSLYSKIASWIWDSIYSWILKFITLAISVLIGFMAWLMTFWILFLSYLMDMIFIKVPYIWDILWAWGDIVFIQTVQMITTIILIFSIAIWLFLWGTSYIKNVFNQITLWLQAWNKWNIFRDLIWKFVVVLLVLSIPFSLPSFFKWVNSISSWILQMEISKFDKQDQIVILSKPLTSLVELGLWLPSSDWMSSKPNDNENKNFTSIHNRSEWEWVINWNLEFSTVFWSIIDKSMFQFWRFVNLASIIGEKEAINNIDSNDSKDVAVLLQDLAQWTQKWLIVFLFISIFYVILLYTIFMKLFSLFMALVTRFVNIIMSSMYLAFHIAMLGSDNTRGFWAKNLWSFVWDIIVTPVIAAFIWIAILILWFFASVIGIWDDSFIYFATWTDISWYEWILFSWMLVLAILYWILNKLNKLVEYVGANFENIISSKWGQWMQDSYATPWEAMNAAWKTWWLWKKVWSMIWVWYAWSMMKWKITNWVKDMIYWDKNIRDIKDRAVWEWAAIANNDLAEKTKLKAIEKYTKKWNNTKIEK